MAEKLTRIAILIVFVVTACTVTAQEAGESTGTAAETTVTTTAAATTTNATLVNETDSRETRERLRQVLHRLPPEVGKVLKLDPSLWANKSYLDTYPALAAFVAAHPEVAHNSRFYLEGIWIPNDPLPETAGMRMWNQTIEVIAILFSVSAAIFVFTWIVRTLINQRRWSRLSRVQSEVHTKLLDRFSSNAEVMAYINTTAGRKFLEAAPIPVEDGAAQPRAISAPVNRVLWSVQAGLILFAGGIGMKLVSWSATEKDAAAAFSAFGMLGMAIGAGFIVSAIASMILSKRLGLWSTPPNGDTPATLTID